MMTLEQVELRSQARVVLIDGGHRVRSHLNTLGIHVGDWIRVVERAPFRGPVLVEIHGSRVALGRGVAKKVKVDLAGYLESLADLDAQEQAEVS
jgi:ferrous iron transport protein A